MNRPRQATVHPNKRGSAQWRARLAACAVGALLAGCGPSGPGTETSQERDDTANSTVPCKVPGISEVKASSVTTLDDLVNGTALLGAPDFVGTLTIDEVRTERPGDARAVERFDEPRASVPADAKGLRRLIVGTVTTSLAGPSEGERVLIHVGAEVPEPDGSMVTTGIPCYSPLVGDVLTTSLVDLDGDGVAKFSSTATGFFVLEDGYVSSDLTEARMKAGWGALPIITETRGLSERDLLEALRQAQDEGS